LLSYTWEYDQEFAERVKIIFNKLGLSVLVFTDNEIESTKTLIESEQISFDAYLDRASDVDERYEPIAILLSKTNTYLINPQKVAEKVIDKGYMHNEALKAGLPLPLSYIIPPLDEQKDYYISENILNDIGKPFVVKPCFHTGGGEGVLKNATHLYDIIQSRGNLPEDSYLIQKKIYPATFFDKRAWFRILWAFGDIYISWWDDERFIYQEITNEEYECLKLSRLEEISRKFSGLCGLDYFSTEAAITESGDIFVIDYVNDQCDFRLKNNHPDGVPEAIVDGFIYSLIKNILKV